MSRRKILQVATSQVGTRENPPGTNKNPYGKWYGLNGYPWCAMFVSWVYHRAGHPLGHIDDANGYRDCKSAYNHWKRTDEITIAPAGGDIVLFDWNNDGRCDHTGIFAGWEDRARITFKCIEGNTSVGDDSDGGMVMERIRNVASVKAFVCPRVIASPTILPPLSLVARYGDRNATVSRIQKLLYDIGYKLVVDGIYGSQTKKSVAAFQKKNGLAVTGNVSETELALMEQTLSGETVAPAKLKSGTYLRQGDSGPAVVALQTALNKSGIKPRLVVDGVFGAKTLAAVKRFQKESGIKADGIVGPGTIKHFETDLDV